MLRIVIGQEFVPPDEILGDIAFFAQNDEQLTYFDGTIRITYGNEVRLVDVLTFEIPPGYEFAGTGVAVDILQVLVTKEDCDVLIHAVGPDLTVQGHDGAFFRVGDHGALVTLPVGSPIPPPIINVVIDATACNGAKYKIRQANGVEIEIPQHILLLHELAHAYGYCVGDFTGPLPPENADYESYAITIENTYRAEGNERIPLGPRPVGDLVKCPLPKPPPRPPPPSSTSGGGDGCIIAESHPTGPRGTHVNDLRMLRDRFLLRTPWGRKMFDRFHRYYYSFSGEVAARIVTDPEMRESIGFTIATPLINYLRLVAAIPRFEPVELEAVPEPFRGFVKTALSDVEEWLEKIDVGRNLTGVPCDEAAIEIAIALRFRFRTAAARHSYIDRLTSARVLPLSGSENDLQSAAALLSLLGATETEVNRVVGGGRNITTNSRARNTNGIPQSDA